MIQDYAYRPKQWINIYSPWDIISGYLDLYDLPKGPPTRRWKIARTQKRRRC